MKLDALERQVRNSLNDLVAEPNGLPLLCDNDGRNEPAEDIPMWMRLMLFMSAYDRKEIGGVSRNFGLMSVSIFVRVGSGTKSVMEMARVLVDTFASKIISSVHYGDAKLQNLGTSGKWYQLNVACPFHADQIGA